MDLFGNATSAPASDYERTAVLALRLAMRVLPEYACRCSRKCFTLRQLAALAVVRAAFNLTYRQLHQLLLASPPLVQALGLKRVPHFTTVEGFANRPDVDALVQRLLTELLTHMQSTTTQATTAAAQNAGVTGMEAAMDSTGLQPTAASVHFQRRKFGHAKAPYKAFAKLSVLVLSVWLVPASFAVGWGPSADTAQASGLVKDAAGRARIGTLYADAGYDSERLHRECREGHGIRSVIRPVVRARDGRVHTPYRASMVPLPAEYGRRWCVEAYFSALKRTTGSSLRARGKVNPLKELALRVLAHAIRR